MNKGINKVSKTDLYEEIHIPVHLRKTEFYLNLCSLVLYYINDDADFRKMPCKTQKQIIVDSIVLWGSYFL